MAVKRNNIGIKSQTLQENDKKIFWFHTSMNRKHTGHDIVNKYFEIVNMQRINFETMLQIIMPTK